MFPEFNSVIKKEDLDRLYAIAAQYEFDEEKKAAQEQARLEAEALTADLRRQKEEEYAKKEAQDRAALASQEELFKKFLNWSRDVAEQTPLTNQPTTSYGTICHSDDEPAPVVRRERRVRFDEEEARSESHEDEEEPLVVFVVKSLIVLVLGLFLFAGVGVALAALLSMLCGKPLGKMVGLVELFILTLLLLSFALPAVGTAHRRLLRAL